MKQHQYEVMVKHLADAKGHPSTYDEALEFKARNHDDIFRVLSLVQEKQLFDEDTTKAFVVGLKLFSEVMLENKESPLFEEFMPHFLQFMKTLKQSGKAQSKA